MKATRILPILLTLASGMSAHSALWWAGDDFVANEVPDGPQELISVNPTVPEWSYGYRSTLESTDLTLFSAGNHIQLGTFQGFQANLATIAVNTSASPQIWPGLSLANNPYEIFMHTGNSNEFSIVRWTAPVADTYQIVAQWRKLDPSGDGVTTDIVINGSSVFGDTLLSLGETLHAEFVALNAGDRVDFVLGANGNNGSDSTAFQASISNIVPVPEPGTASFGAGLLVLAAIRRRRASRA